MSWLSKKVKHVKKLVRHPNRAFRSVAGHMLVPGVDTRRLTRKYKLNYGSVKKRVFPKQNYSFVDNSSYYSGSTPQYSARTLSRMTGGV